MWRKCRAFVCVVTVAGGIGAAEANDRSDDLVRMVIDAIRSNYSMIKTADVSISEISEDARVRKLDSSVKRNAHGGEIRITRVPRAEWKVRVVTQGDDMRLDRVPSESGPRFGEESRACLNGVWTHYTPGSSAAWIHKTEDLPGMFPEDPRQLGSDDVRRSVIDILREDRLVSAELTKSEAGEALVRVVAESNKVVRTTYEFGAKSGFLPVRLMTRWPDGSVLQLVDFEYQDVLDGKAKFLKRLTRRFFAKGATEKPATTGWRQSLVREVEGLVLNEAIRSERFEIELPPNTRVCDNVRQVIYRATEPVSETRQTRWPYTVALVGVIVALISLRTYKHTRTVK